MSNKPVKFYVYKIGKQDHRILLPQWVSNKKMQTWYPPGDQADVDECILNNEIPNPETWKIIDVAAKIAEKDDFIKAKDCLAMIEKMTDVESEVDDVKFKKSRSKRHKRLYSYDSESQVFKTNKRPKPSTTFVPLLRCKNQTGDEETPKAQQVSITEQSTVSSKNDISGYSSANDDNLELKTDKVIPSVLHNSPVQETHNLMDTATEDDLGMNALKLADVAKLSERQILQGMSLLTKKMNSIIQTQKEIKKELKSMQNISMNPINSSYVTVSDDLDGLLPLRSLEQLNELDNKLKNKNFFDTTALYMKAIGGEEIHDLTQGILKRFMSDSLAVRFNMDGKFLIKKDDGGNDLVPKLPFKETLLYKCIIKAAKLKDSTKMNEAILRSKTIGPWLAGSTLRLERLKKKMENKTKTSLTS